MADTLNDLLRRTSRSFYLTLRVLPSAVRHQIGLAYLLARTTDTIADTEIIPLTQRLAALHDLRAAILGQTDKTPDFGELARQQGQPAERALLENFSAALAQLVRQTPADRDLIRAVLDTITTGQTLDLQRFAANPPGTVTALATAAELHDYTYRVAGCVGEFWTKICRAHVFPRAPLDDSQFLADGIRFGQGLQLVNILRDLPADLKNGRCYLPADELTRLGLTPTDLLNLNSETKLRPLYDAWLNRADDHLTAGWRYTNSIPWRHARVRLACAWPVLIGQKTLAQLRQNQFLDPAQRIKISRVDVKKIIAQSVVRYPFPGLWRNLGQHSPTTND